VEPEHVIWELPAKLHRATGGPEGTLVMGKDSLVFRTTEGNHARTWRIEEITGVASTDAHHLAVTTQELRGLFRSPADFYFTLKRPLSEDRFRDLWRLIHRSRGLPILNSFRIGETQ
jgi:hypothetical protein